MPNLKDLQAQVNEEVEYEGQLKQTVPEGLTEEKQSHSKPIAQSVWDEIVSAGETVPNNMIL